MQLADSPSQSPPKLSRKLKYDIEDPSSKFPPGKKSRNVKVAIKTHENACRLSTKMIFSSKKNEKDKQKYGIMNLPMGCDTEDCDYWVHVHVHHRKILTI